MNPEHLKAFVWLRWRIRMNQLRKGGLANQIVLAFVGMSVLMAAVGLFVGGFFAGLYGLPEAKDATVRLLVWDGVVAAFLFTWAVGLLAEIQRSDPLTVSKFLHLPVSPAGVFLVNYVSSLFSISLGLFAAAVGGLLLGQVFAVGPVILLAVPPFLAFVFAVTALTYQLQGWLAVLMSNPRRRRTVIVLVTFGFILLVQIPNLFNILRVSKIKKATPPTLVTFPTTATPATAPAGTFPPTRVVTPDQIRQEREERDRQETAELGETVWLMNVVLPPAWFPLGAAALADGGVVPALLGTLGLTAIGAFCLRRAYRTTVRYHTDQTGERGGKPAKVVATTGPTTTGKPRLVEWQLPRMNERAAAVATSAFRGLVRAPEAKMMLLAPVIMVVVFGGILLSVPADKLPSALRPVIAVGATAFIFVAGVQIAGNMFGYDRSGFRAYVLSPIPRRDVLLGKNLANAPLTLGIAAVVALLVGLVLPMRWDHYPAVVVALTGLYLLCCLLTNALSILAPIPMAPGAMQPSNVKMVPVLWQFGFMMVYPFVVAGVLAPFGVEALVEETTDVRGWPVALALSLGVAGIAAVLYRRLLDAQGDWLQRREKDILLVVTSKSE